MLCAYGAVDRFLFYINHFPGIDTKFFILRWYDTIIKQNMIKENKKTRGLTPDVFSIKKKLKKIIIFQEISIAD
jgi:hypothetical protein